jgi:hypothetical protein
MHYARAGAQCILTLRAVTCIAVSAFLTDPQQCLPTACLQTIEKENHIVKTKSKNTNR